MTTINVASRIPEDHYNQIILSGEKPAEFIRKAIEEKLGNSNLETINKKIKQHQETVEKLKIKKKLIQEKENRIINTPKKELDWISETAILLKENPHIFEGRYSYYCNVFPKDYKVTKQDFKKILDYAENKNKEVEVLDQLNKVEVKNVG